MDTYKIVRHFFDAPNITVARGYTLEEAQEHCKRDDTHGETEDGQLWFDSYDVADEWIGV